MRWAVGGVVLMLAVAAAGWLSVAPPEVDDEGLTAADREHLRERAPAFEAPEERRKPRARPGSRRSAPEVATPPPVALEEVLGVDYAAEVEANVVSHLERGAEPARGAIQDLFVGGAISEEAMGRITPVVDRMDQELEDIERQLDNGSVDVTEAAAMAAEVQSEAYTAVMGHVPPQLGLRLLKSFSGPTSALEDL